ncbi:MAG: hypothetical protein PHW93_06400 [Candidatus Methanomethylophilaceae archaeon]|nr:hypothetical protein [Candidatus Methanomethylophilaceae archaeon]
MKVKLYKSEINDVVFRAVAQTFFKNLQKNTFVGRKTVNKARIMSDWQLKKTKNYLHFQFVNPNFFEIYAQEHGIPKMIISAKNKKFLKFKKTKTRKSTYEKIPGNQAFEADGYVYAKMVRHPGFEGRRFIDKTMNDTKTWKEFDKQIEKIFYAEVTSRLKN